MYNYLDDAMGITFTKAEDYMICDSTRINCSVRATICGKCYQDPDAVSRKLYDDISAKFGHIFENKLKVSGTKSQWYLSPDDLYEHQLSTDYIGPSRKWALSFLDGENEEKAKRIGEFLLTSRTIGGHLFWPAHKVDEMNTINQIRGGSPTFDRIDITLAELKNFYESRYEGSFQYDEKLYGAFKRYQWFFEKFGTFPNYVKKMKMDMFIHNEHVISLLDSDLEKGVIKPLTPNSEHEPQDYIRYISNCTNLINKRSNEIAGNTEIQMFSK